MAKLTKLAWVAGTVATLAGSACSDEGEADGSGGATGSTSTMTASSASGAGGAGGGGLVWEPCGSRECTTVEVPADDVDPANGTIGLRVMRSRASVPEERIGTLLVFPGGPGPSGVDGGAQNLISFLVLMPEIEERFDIVFYDRRGTGASAPLACVDAAWAADWRATALNPTTPQEWSEIDDLWQRLADGCAQAMASFPLPTMGSETAVRDADRIREALGEDTISFYAFSYGGLSGASYANLFPDRVRAGVLDAPISPYGPTYLDHDGWTRMALAHQAALDGFFAACDADVACAFHGGPNPGDTAARYDALASALAVTPLDVGGRPVGEFDLAGATYVQIADVLGDPALLHPALAQMLADAEAGMGEALLDAADWFFIAEDGVYELTILNAFLTIQLADAACPAGFDLAAAQAAWPSIVAVSPRLAPAIFSRALSCLHWPTPLAAAPVIEPTDAALLVVNSANDTQTPPSGVQAMHTALGAPGEIVTWQAYAHVAAFTSPCMGGAVSSFLVDPAAYTPPPGNTCAADE